MHLQICRRSMTKTEHTMIYLNGFWYQYFVKFVILKTKVNLKRAVTKWLIYNQGLHINFISGQLSQKVSIKFYLFFSIPTIGTELTFFNSDRIQHIIQPIKPERSKIQFLTNFFYHLFIFGGFWICIFH